ncbi:hypothetical protein [Acinetobacter stercoris]|uniref:hypothetical protein n=1 Tax=Acinetobacter stercoris TaxID=2126983 RepID=UPI00148C8CEA|nr:hypothetical protein [Acinetobacter stercoris]
MTCELVNLSDFPSETFRPFSGLFGTFRQENSTFLASSGKYCLGKLKLFIL